MSIYLKVKVGYYEKRSNSRHWIENSDDLEAMYCQDVNRCNRGRRDGHCMESGRSSEWSLIEAPLYMHAI